MLRLHRYKAVEPKIRGGFYPPKSSPNHPFVHRGFHEINHPFSGSPIFANTHKKLLEMGVLSRLSI